MKKVLMTAKHLDAGGVETFIVGMYPFIDKTKYQIDFVITRERETNDPRGYFENELRCEGAKIYRISRKSKNPFKAYRDLKRLFEQHPEYGIFHINDGGGAALPLLAARRSGINKIIVHSHNTGAKSWKQNLIMTLFRDYVSRYAKCVACSRNAGQWMFGKKASFEILHYGIDTDRFKFNQKIRAEVRDELHIDGVLVGHVGRFNIQKNHDFLADVFYEIQLLHQNAKLLLIGKGELENSIKKKFEMLGIAEKVIFLGTTKNVEKYLSAMDVFVFPSLFEGFGLAHIEAQCNGLPCILSNTISEECRITDRVIMIDLQKKASEWAEKAIEVCEKSDIEQRKNYYRVISEKGFDRKVTAQSLEKIYGEL